VADALRARQDDDAHRLGARPQAERAGSERVSSRRIVERLLQHAAGLRLLREPTDDGLRAFVVVEPLLAWRLEDRSEMGR
jgi:hypothetical protein